MNLQLRILLRDLIILTQDRKLKKKYFTSLSVLGMGGS